MPSLHRLGLSLRTARHLRPQQLAAQLVHRVRGPARTPRRTIAEGITALSACPSPWAPSPEGRPDAEGRVALVGRPAYDPRRMGWEPGQSALWSYTLHYHGWLNERSMSPGLAASIIDSWIGEHREGVGWEPYPTSMRVLHWLGWLHQHGAGLQAHARERMLGSLAAQLEHLAAHVETHIDGNHLWTNLVALTCAGAALRGPLPQRLLERFGPRSLAVVREQLAGDGVHGERTPTYHVLLAEQLAVLLSYARVTQPLLADALEPALDAMVAVLPAFTHPDGDVALWGDSQRDAPVTPAGLVARLGGTLGSSHADAPVSGFGRRCFGPLSLLWNRGGVGLPHQPGHVHADALSIELSVGDTRVLVDAGVGTYEVGPERAYARSTAAHNTVSVGGADQHELWASHRIGARGRTETLAQAEHRLEGRVWGHDGSAAHRRVIEYEPQRGTFVVADALEPGGGPATVRYFVPASLPLTVDGEVAEVVAAGRRLRLRALGASWCQGPAPGWLGMGRPASRVCLSLPLHGDGARVEIGVVDEPTRS
ncbi:heparinase II/III domain-containing protein [Paraliomyxa miuraensis]|uniref:heparinase II/III domain-containing protein n=1 Tax=Paraliomyxa miuraensis TaxID=376150 RepID=UPI002256F210|nr:heparinase II/III family protein [Paraliomyxa miuraensis]MCX4244370.1 heparinase II/III family protein [Paraliomyxa miuraensis]